MKKYKRPFPTEAWTEDDILIHEIAMAFDFPAVYMGGPSDKHLQMAYTALKIIKDNEAK